MDERPPPPIIPTQHGSKADELTIALSQSLLYASGVALVTHVVQCSQGRLKPMDLIEIELSFN